MDIVILVIIHLMELHVKVNIKFLIEIAMLAIYHFVR